MLAELPAIKLPTDDSLLTFHQAINVALSDLMYSNKDVSKFVVSGSALQMMFNFPYVWLGQDRDDQFVEVMTQQAKAFIEAKRKANP
jgi:hypothetical protein